MKSFVNMVSGAHQCEEPPQFFGGIIADLMGLGKTLTMIALVATDLQQEFALKESAGDIESNKATLVIVPPPCAC
jgi:SNF2 family DNA or RNA helicase